MLSLAFSLSLILYHTLGLSLALPILLDFTKLWLHLDDPSLFSILFTNTLSIPITLSLSRLHLTHSLAAVSAPILIYSSKLLLWLHIDDPLDAAPVHLGGGVWGLLAGGLFADRGYVEQVCVWCVCCVCGMVWYGVCACAHAQALIPLLS